MLQKAISMVASSANAALSRLAGPKKKVGVLWRNAGCWDKKKKKRARAATLAAALPMERRKLVRCRATVHRHSDADQRADVGTLTDGWIMLEKCVARDRC